MAAQVWHDINTLLSNGNNVTYWKGVGQFTCVCAVASTVQPGCSFLKDHFLYLCMLTHLAVHLYLNITTNHFPKLLSVNVTGMISCFHQIAIHFIVWYRIYKYGFPDTSMYNWELVARQMLSFGRWSVIVWSICHLYSVYRDVDADFVVAVVLVTLHFIFSHRLTISWTAQRPAVLMLLPKTQ